MNLILRGRQFLQVASQARSKMKCVFTSLTVCIVTAVAVPALAQNPPVYRDPHTSRATMGPDAHDGMAANQRSARGPVYHPVSRHARIHYRGAPPQKRAAQTPRPMRTAGSTADQLNRDELARLQGDAQTSATEEAAPVVAATPRALAGPKASSGGR